ncbi:MAG: hypothetical protein CVU10_10290 [Bacteroidetes bacterium HGW-Bacteroidetes-5]|nr:MAG: hypothetical protein CVU10_10290 [Bacteroidetes bacterium HGW-Bacteroidetes-5]
MKRFFLMLFVVFISVGAGAQGINFQELTLNEAIAKAKAENKFVFIDSYTDWCGPCKMMDKEIYPMKEMGDYFNPKFISLKLNAEKGVEGPAVKEKFGIKAYPTFVILDGDGKLLHMFAGGVLGLAFIDKIEESFNPEKAFGTLQKRYNSGERDKKLVASYIMALQATYTADVTELINQFESSLTEDERICEECMFLYDDYARLESARGKFLTDNLEKFRTKVGRDKIDLVMKKKYEAYYAGIIGKQRVPNFADFEEKNRQLALLNLKNDKILPVYQAAVKTYISKEGANSLFSLIKEVAPKIESNEMDRFLYFAIPSLLDLWTKQQTEEIIALVKNDKVIESATKALEKHLKVTQPVLQK